MRNNSIAIAIDCLHQAIIELNEATAHYDLEVAKGDIQLIIKHLKQYLKDNK